MSKRLLKDKMVARESFLCNMYKLMIGIMCKI